MESQHCKFLRICRYVLVLAGFVGCCMNLWQIVKDALKEPTVTKIVFEYHEQLPLPTFSLRPVISGLQMLDPTKILDAVQDGSLSYDYMNALVRGIGTDVSGYDWPNNISNHGEIESQYNRAIEEYGSIVEARLALQRDYGVACEAIFSHCSTGFSPPFNCCDYVELIWGTSGALGFVMNGDSVSLHPANDLQLRLHASPVDDRLDSLKTAEELHDRGYQMFIQAGVDQTGWSIGFPAALKETIHVQLRQKKRIVTNNCVKDPHLKYFRDYSIAACAFEHCIFDQLAAACNITCQIPLFQLMKPGLSLTNPCGFQDIMNLYVEQPCSRLYEEGFCGKDPPYCNYQCEETDFQVTFTRQYNPLKANITEVWVFYESNEVEVIKDISRFNVGDYLGLIGGILGLWLGISFASVYKMIVFGLAKLVQYRQRREEDIDSGQVQYVACQSV